MNADFEKRRRFYRGGAHPADRFVAAPCGCVMKVPLLDAAPPGTIQSEWAYQCAHCQVNTGIRALVTPEMHAVTSLQATTYLHVPNQDGEGIRWQ